MLPHEHAPPGFHQRYARSPVDQDMPAPATKRIKVDESWERGQQLPFSSAGAYDPGASAMGPTAGFT